jgi:undecaprenyl-diphosphatase
MNEKLFILINQFAGINSFLDKFNITLAEYTPYFFILILFYFWFKPTKNNSTHKNFFKNITLFAGYSAILGIIINRIISFFYFHPRPFMENLGTSLIEHTAESSFPSDHTTFMLAIAFVFVYSSSTKKIGLYLIMLGILSGFARIFTGLHFPMDILGSLIIACVSATIIFQLKNNLKKINTPLINKYVKLFNKN